MSGWDVLGIGLIVVTITPVLVRVVGRWSQRQWDKHVSMAQLLAVDSGCLCADPARPGWLHSRVRCVPPVQPCQCRGSLSDASGVWHDPTLCAPLRETVLDGRWGQP